MNVLITGGCGYIGSITSLQLAAAGHRPVILDNLCNGHAAVIDRIEELARVRPTFIQADVRDTALVERALNSHAIDAVIHFAGLKAVGESVASPLSYYENNVAGTLSLIRAMHAASVSALVFSSSATVYDAGHGMPLSETAATAPSSPYGRTKLMSEDLLRDIAAANPGWSITLLRYFNPVGAHPSGRMGEDPRGVPNNLMPFLAQVAVGRRERLQIFGADYPTPDGTGIRDYIHVVDLADGHVAALERRKATPGVHTYNLGTGVGHSVLELHAAFARACGRPLPYDVVARRAGDVAACWADVRKAQAELSWRATRSIDEICQDTWRWQAGHPLGYGD